MLKPFDIKEGAAGGQARPARVLIHFPIGLFIAGVAFEFLGNGEAAPAGRRGVLACSAEIHPRVKVALAMTANETYVG